MPGLAGIIGKGDPQAHRQDLDKMIQVMRHEPFYVSGTLVDEKQGVFVGWTAHPGGYSDCLPITNEERNVTLLFSGEHFADRADYEALKNRGHGLNRHNASALVHLYEESGLDFLRKLNGWFHGVLIDHRSDLVAVFNDRFGMQRLYYYEESDRILFASEAKSILRVRKELRSLDPQGLGEFLVCDCVLQNRTLFPKLRTLPGASCWTFRGAALLKKKSYFAPQEWEDQPPLETEQLFEKLYQLLPGLVGRYLESDIPAAVSMTGGLDTRMLMSLIGRNPRPLPCYTFGGMYRESLDVELARTTATTCGQPHQVLTLGKEFLAAFPALARKTVYVSDGGLGACGAYELYLNGLARAVAPIRLTGNYGSEVFRGLRGVKAVVPAPEMVPPDVAQSVQLAMNTFSAIDQEHKLTFSVFRQAPWYGYGRMSVEQSQVTVRTPFMDNDLVGLMYQAPEVARATPALQWRLIGRMSPGLVAIPTDRALRGKPGALSSRWAYLSSYFLFKADYLAKSGMPQWMEQLHFFLRWTGLQKRLIGRHRFTFFRIWFREELAGYLREVLLDPSTLRRPIHNARHVEEIVRRHLRGDRNYTNEIEKVLTLELMCRSLMDSPNA
jgi:asparagine synthase (glutamine-hydrolysing)